MQEAPWRGCHRCIVLGVPTGAIIVVDVYDGVIPTSHTWRAEALPHTWPVKELDSVSGIQRSDTAPDVAGIGAASSTMSTSASASCSNHASIGGKYRSGGAADTRSTEHSKSRPGDRRHLADKIDRRYPVSSGPSARELKRQQMADWSRPILAFERPGPARLPTFRMDLLRSHTAVTLNRSQRSSTCRALSFSARSFRRPLRWKIA